jgi:hypothetical protein
MLYTNEHSSDEVLQNLLKGEASERGERLVIEERDRWWYAETFGPDPLFGEVRIMSAAGPNKRSVLLTLSELFERAAQAG